MTLDFASVHRRDGLVRLDGQFLDHLEPELRERLIASRQAPPTGLAESDLLLALAPHLDDFLTALFGIRAEAQELAARHAALAPLWACKRLFVQRRAVKAFKPEQAAALDGDALGQSLAALLGGAWDEEAFARAVAGWLDDEAAHGEALDLAARYAAWAVHTPEGQRRHAGGVLFKVPAKRDPLHLVPGELVERDGVAALVHPALGRRDRDGFDLTDPGMGLKGALDQATYCILCHHQGKDSCSKGLHDKATGAFQLSAVGDSLTGCPLEEKISEMHEAKGRGWSLAALACAVIDNPMVAGTGHRICNDCVAACIYNNQHKDPVDVPQVETRVLKDVLSLPWGFEIYSLLTRWNPLNLRRPLPRPETGRSVLVVGLGPAGYTLAHHLMQDGHRVVAIDGLKIEPLAEALSGPIRDASVLFQRLGERPTGGFGGVAEYGITVRWDKNFLTVLRLLLERRAEFRMYGGIRFGGAIGLDDAFAMGFDHVALCMGAGKPTVLGLPGGLSRGVRTASDFLMALQLTGAARRDSVANLQIRLPVVVIGGGLTAIDTCTEALAYYPVQVEKFLSRLETLGEEPAWSEEEAVIAAEFTAHARALRAARAEGRPIGALLESWGGATIAYRRTLTEAPAYRNHEEITKALEEGIRFAEGLTPLEVVTDRFGHAEALRVRRADGTETMLAARAVLIAAGTQPNTTLARETEGIALDGRHFRALGEGKPEASTKPAEARVLMRRRPDGRAVSFFGDLHPSYAGNVVSAMAGALQGHPVVTQAMAELPPPAIRFADLVGRLDADLGAVVERVERLAPNIVEVVVRAPAAARAFRPGQFYRLQNFEAHAPRAAGTVLAMEGIALTGAWVDRDRGLVSLIVLEMGGSSSLCAHLRPGEPVVLMGPTGTPTEIPSGETVLLAGGGLGNAVLFSIGQALRAAGSRVLYFAGYRGPADRFKIDEIEAAADVVVWGVDQGEAFAPRRPGDHAFVGNIVEAMRAYGEGRLGPATIPLETVDRILVIGSDRMMAAVAAARHGVLAPLLPRARVAIGSINSPMQCMMKEICGQCIQTHIDPVTGEKSVVFSCMNQDQPLDHVDFPGLNQRLRQNAVQEKVTRSWIAHCLNLPSTR
ncbi:MAG: FAD-dependent oxidoreductase [Alphaproteobacteria bacterium]|nr:FAD-dependent oxidoreductase [Alphaproteobacteria bacterium]